MKLELSYAIALHRVFDSAAPEYEAIFRAGGRALHPCRKGGGLYVFMEEPEQAVEIFCSAYQTITVQAKRGETTQVCLYPDGSFPPPYGWSLTLGRAPPGTVAFWEDTACDVRLQECNCVKGYVRLRASPGFIGGCLKFSKNGFSQLSFILGKEPPDRYYMSAVDKDFLNCRVEKGYAARSGMDGTVAVLSPAGFLIDLNEQGVNTIWDLAR